MLAAEQASDETLSDCRVMADAAKGGFYWRNNLLYHADQVGPRSTCGTTLCTKVYTQSCLEFNA